MKVMQCWDDGVDNDIPLVELLKKRNAKATFNLNPGITQRSARSPWNKLFKDRFRPARLSLDEMKTLYKGFRVAGHTMTHPRPNQLPPEQLRAELVDCRAFLEDFFEQEVKGFAYPFGEYNEEVKKAVKDAGYLYARTTKNVDGPLKLDDPMELHSHCHFMSPDFWRKYEAVREAGGVFYFWGHSYEMMDEKALWDEFDAKLARIDADPEAEWIDVIDLFS